MIYVCVALAALLAVAVGKCLLYYAACCGLMFYIYEKYGEELSEEQAREIQSKAIRRLIRDAMGK